MALEAGVMALTIQYAKDLKDCDWFGKQDPYVVVRCGNQIFRSRTAVGGGRNPVWDETFSFNMINENSAEVKIYDEDTFSKDDLIGECVLSLAKAREQGHDSVQVPVISAKSKKQHGFIAMSLKFTTNHSLKPQQHQPAALQPQQPQYAMPPPMPMPMAAMPYGYPPAAPYPAAAPYYPTPVPQPYAPYPMYSAAAPQPQPQPATK